MGHAHIPGIKHFESITERPTTPSQPTGMALTPVPHSLPFSRPFFPAMGCFLPPRCFSSSSSSPTVHVRFPAAFCSMPDVVENRWGRSGSVETSSSHLPAVACFSWRFFYKYRPPMRPCTSTKCQWTATLTLCPCNSLFRSLTLLNRLSLFPPPPAVSSTFILRPSISDWCSLSACWRALRWLNSKKAQPFDLAVGLPGADGLGVRRRIVGGGSEESIQL